MKTVVYALTALWLLGVPAATLSAPVKHCVYEAEALRIETSASTLEEAQEQAILECVEARLGDKKGPRKSSADIAADSCVDLECQNGKSAL